jgi:hypothetical protein
MLLKVPQSEINLLISDALANENFYKINNFLADYNSTKSPSINL